MVTASFHMAVWTILFFVLGMIKPKWPLFFLKKPDRFIVIAVTTVLVMMALTMYGEGISRKKLEQDTLKKPPVTAVSPATAPLPQTAPATTPQ